MWREMAAHLGRTGVIFRNAEGGHGRSPDCDISPPLGHELSVACHEVRRKHSERALAARRRQG
jgi:hypothetical protein